MAEEMTALGAILTIIIIGVIYYIFTNFDAKQADKATDRHVKKTLADVEMAKVKAQEEETKLKREFFEYEKNKLLEQKANPKPASSSSDQNKRKTIDVSYRIKDENSENASGKKE